MSRIKQREVEGVHEKQAEARRQIGDEQQRQPGSSPADRLNGDIAVVDPEQHWRQKKALWPRTTREVADQFGQRQDAVTADEPLRLHGEGDEGREVNQPEQAQEQE